MMPRIPQNTVAMETHLLTTEEIRSIYIDRPRYLMIARSYVRNDAIAEDIFQDSILFFLENRGKLEIQSVKSYFLRIIISRCLNHLSKCRRQDEIRESIRETILEFETVAINSGRNGDRMALMSEMNDRLNVCRKRLSPLCFNVFLASRLTGLSHKEIAEKFGITIRRVNTEIQKALKVFRGEFREYLSMPVLLPLLALLTGQISDLAVLS